MPVLDNIAQFQGPRGSHQDRGVSQADVCCTNCDALSLLVTYTRSCILLSAFTFPLLTSLCMRSLYFIVTGYVRSFFFGGGTGLCN